MNKQRGYTIIELGICVLILVCFFGAIVVLFNAFTGRLGFNPPAQVSARCAEGGRFECLDGILFDIDSYGNRNPVVIKGEAVTCKR